MRKFFRHLSFLLLAGFCLLVIVGIYAQNLHTQTVKLSEFKQYINDGKFENVIFTTDKLIGEFKERNGSFTVAETGVLLIDEPEIVKLLDASDIPYTVSTASSMTLIFNSLIPYITGFVVFFIAYVLFKTVFKNSTQKLFSHNSTVTKLDADSIGVKFADVAGQEEAKESLIEIIDIMKNGEKYTKMGAKLPKGVLLVGPPGTGKTLMAKAVAGEAGVTFFETTASSFVEMYVGRGAARIRSLFKEAKENSPCIIFIDEIDTLGESRASQKSHPEHEQTLNQFLAEMDGFGTDCNILVIGATNRPEILDLAFTRPGRFDRQVVISNPDFKGRQEILKVHSRDKQMAELVDFESIARATSGASGADIANILNEAALLAVKKDKNFIETIDIAESIETVMAGKEKKNQILSPKYKKLVAYHEVGHALVAALLTNTDQVQKISIIPRVNGALGYTMQIPEDEKVLYSRSDLIEKIKVYLGGRVAEELVFSDITTGASDDLAKCNNIARKMVTMYGMSDTLGSITCETATSKYLGSSSTRTCSDSTYALADSEVKLLLSTCYSAVKMLLEDHRSLLDVISNELLIKETLTGVEFAEILLNNGIELEKRSSAV